MEADGIPETGAQRIGLTLRLAGDGDVRVLRALVNRAYHELAEMGLNLTGTYQDEDITRERMQGKEVFLAYLGDTVAGTISLEAGQPSGEERILYLNQLAVAPGCRRKGVGRFLLDLAEKRARELGIPRLQLDTAVPAEHLLRFYRRAGYEVVDEVQRPGKTYRSVIMEKRLAER